MDAINGWEVALEKANQSKRCGAKTRAKTACNAPAMANGRCRMHGGKSTGAPYGKAHGRYKHGMCTNKGLSIVFNSAWGTMGASKAEKRVFLILMCVVTVWH